MESERGKGSTFRVVLPASGAALAAEVEAGRPVLPRARILVVDDEPLVGNVLQRLLGGRHEWWWPPVARRRSSSSGPAPASTCCSATCSCPR